MNLWPNLQRLGHFLLEFFRPFEALWRGGVLAWVQILLLAVVVYIVLKFLRGGRGVVVLRGILFLIAVSYVCAFLAARMLGLEHIAWAFGSLAPVFVLALPIVFQTELRRGLLRLGLNPLFSRFVRATSPTLEEVVDAVVALSRQRIGALIAIERHVPLTPYFESGTPLNAEIASKLLQTIFYKGTELHDGAVIIQGSRLAAAGCKLPLAEDPEFATQLGTRHLAALGLSEESDAVTIVVSEETGRISLGVDGKLEFGITPEQLRSRLVYLCLEAVEGAA
jgi:diadenylate cyclase